MAYASVRGRKPMERASKIAHTEVIANPRVQEYLANCNIPTPPNTALVESLLIPISPSQHTRVKAVIAIDGGFRETAIRDEYPSSSITFFTFGPLFFRLEDLQQLDTQAFIAPEDLARLKRIQRYSLVLPTKNVSLKGKTLQQSVREALQEFLLEQPHADPPLMDALRWLLFQGWQPGVATSWTLPSCPNVGCGQREIELTDATPNETTCVRCGGPIYLVDTLRLHEVIDEERGAGEILSYVMTALEQIVLVHLIMAAWRLRPQMLQEILFIKDGPLALFGQTASLSRPMRDLARFLLGQPEPSGKSDSTIALLNVVGLEKSGAFVEHAMQIDDRLAPGTIFLLSNDYIARYIVPSDPNSLHPYGSSTYWGQKLIFKARDGNTYVASIPTLTSSATPELDDFPNLEEILSVLSSLRCSMYDNALIPIALANKLVSLSEFPSARILENFGRGTVR